MESGVPDIYFQLLEQEAGNVSFERMEEIVRLFENKRESIQRASSQATRDSFDQATRIRNLLNFADNLSHRDLLIALGALQYLVRDEDHTHDSHCDGHIDDACVIQAAITVLRTPLESYLSNELETD